MSNICMYIYILCVRCSSETTMACHQVAVPTCTSSWPPGGKKTENKHAMKKSSKKCSEALEKNVKKKTTSAFFEKIQETWEQKQHGKWLEKVENMGNMRENTCRLEKKTHGTKMDQILRNYGKNKHGKDGKTGETLRENKNTWAKMEKHSMGNIRNMKNMWGIEHRTQLSWGLNE